MKMTWLYFVVLTILCWGAYVPTIHAGQTSFSGKTGALRAFMFVGVAYFMLAGAVLVYLYMTRQEPLEFAVKGVSLSTFAGVLGAIGALGIVFAIRYGGNPLIVAPIVFAGAPVVNTIVSMMIHKPASPPRVWFYVGIVLAAGGAFLALRFKPK